MLPKMKLMYCSRRADNEQEWTSIVAKPMSVKDLGKSLRLLRLSQSLRSVANRQHQAIWNLSVSHARSVTYEFFSRA